MAVAVPYKTVLDMNQLFSGVAVPASKSKEKSKFYMQWIQYICFVINICK